jgi:xylan 1,4-beta-xylosidase
MLPLRCALCRISFCCLILHTVAFIGSAQLAQQVVTIRVDASATVAPFKPIWRYFGYDEPNYTYTKNGQRLVSELSSLSPRPVFIRTHNLLTSGDGAAALKWGSTNAYTEDAAGHPVYDWTIVDRIIDTYVQRHAKPFMEIGFMPQALSTHPEPYRHSWPKGGIDTGWAYPPKDYKKWRDLVFEWVRHSVQRYGREEVESWYWEVWNEPNIMYWHGTPQEFNKLYDFAVDGVKKALPSARVGGPATTGPLDPKAAEFLRQFLAHCVNGVNEATGKMGAPLDFITFHAKGRPEVVEGKVRMGVSANLKDVASGFDVVRQFPQFRQLPIILSESDPEGCAACSASDHPQNTYRNGPLYAAYTAVVFNSILKLADAQQVNIEGMLTWAFEFEDQPYFDGFRTLATNGIDKAILNLFRMDGLLTGSSTAQRIEAISDGAVDQRDILSHGVRNQPDIDALAVLSANALSILVWNYHDVDQDRPDANVALNIAGLPADAKRILLHHYRIDRDHSNAYELWKRLGSPQSPSPEQYQQLESASQLQLLESPSWMTPAGNGVASINFALPGQSVSLVQLAW